MTDAHVVVLERLAEADESVLVAELTTDTPMDPLLDHDPVELHALCEPLEAAALIATAGPDQYRLTSRGQRFLSGGHPIEDPTKA